MGNIRRGVITMVALYAFAAGLAACNNDSQMKGDAAENEDATVEDLAGDELDATIGEGDGSGGGCGQELPRIAGQLSSICGERFPASCLQTGCGPCQVCYVDKGGPYDPAYDSPAVLCTGDGRCHDLCGSSADCNPDEECVNLGWLDGTDVFPMECLRVCWSKDDPTTELCR